MRFAFVGGSYTSRSTAVADEEAINLFAETTETEGTQAKRSYFGTPGLTVFAAFPAMPVRGQLWTGTRLFAVGGTNLYEVFADGTVTARGNVASDGAPVSMAASSVEMLIVSAGQATCYTLASNTSVDVTGLLAGVPLMAEYADGYFIVTFRDSNKFQMSDILDGATWPGLYVNQVSVFAENIKSIIVNHRELWVFGGMHAQPYQDTGSDNIFDVIPGCLIEKGSGAAFAPCKLDNSVFWIDEDERGSRSAWRSQGYTPARISTHAVETDLATYAGIAGMTSYAYQDGGHIFWVLYVPSAPWSWCFDLSEGLWHKRAAWLNGAWAAHHSWNHVHAFGKHLVGDWATGNLYEMTLSALDDAGAPIRRLRRAPTVANEMERILHAELTVDFDTGQGPQPELLDGEGNPRPPQAMLRWSDDRGKTWSNEQVRGLGMAGEYKTRAIWRRLGQSRYRVYELSFSDPTPLAIVDAYLTVGS